MPNTVFRKAEKNNYVDFVNILRSIFRSWQTWYLSPPISQSRNFSNNNPYVRVFLSSKYGGWTQMKVVLYFKRTHTCRQKSKTSVRLDCVLIVHSNANGQCFAGLGHKLMHSFACWLALCSAEAPVGKHQWKKNTGAGALEGENGNARNDGKTEKVGASFLFFPSQRSPRALIFLSSQPPRVFLSARFSVAGLCGGESSISNNVN